MKSIFFVSWEVSHGKGGSARKSANILDADFMVEKQTKLKSLINTTTTTIDNTTTTTNATFNITITPLCYYYYY